MNSGSLEALFRSPYFLSTLHFRSNPTPDIFHASLGRTLAFTSVNLQAPIFSKCIRLQISEAG